MRYKHLIVLALLPFGPIQKSSAQTIYQGWLDTARSTQQPSQKSSVATPYAPGPSRGGMLGVENDGKVYQCGINSCVKIIAIHRTNFTGLSAGDYIYAVRGYHFNDAATFKALVQEGSPGSQLNIYFLDASNNYQSMQQTAALVPMEVAPIATPANAQYNLDAQLDELARLDAKGWIASSYRAGSMNNSRISHVSADGATIVARGQFRYGYGSLGSVEARFVNGRFFCIQFDDDSRCRNLYRPDRAANGAMALAAAAVAVTVIAITASSSSKGGYASNSYGGGNGGGDGGGGGGGSNSLRQEEERRAKAERDRQEREKTPPIGGHGGLYSCVNPPCW